MKRLDQDADEAFLKVAVYGPPGTGKTSLGVTAPDPLILLSERQGMPHVRAAAARLGKAVPPVLFMQSLNDYRDVLRALIAGPHHETKTLRVTAKDGAVAFECPFPKTVVVDSLTDACALVREEVYSESPPEKAKDGLEKITERHWGALKDRCEKLVRAFRNVPAHVLFLAHADDRTVGEGDQAERMVTPMLPMRSLPSFLCGAVNLVGISTREIEQKKRAEDGNREIVFKVRTTAPSYFMLKPYRPLADVEEPDFTLWVNKLLAAGKGV